VTLDLNNLYSGYLKASTYNPVDRKTLKRALSPYKLSMAAGAGLSDSQIRRLAARSVLTQFRATQKAK
jgi:hypothetical protein